MEIIDPDVYRCESQLAIKAEDGTITDRRIVTRREWFTAVLGARPRARILLDADAVHRTGERLSATAITARTPYDEPKGGAHCPTPRTGWQC